MITIYSNTHLGWQGNTSINHYELFIDSTSDLPSDPYYFSSEKGTYKIAQGSMAYDISTATMYMMNSSGTWVEQ